jgi:hypothetical protein
MIQRVQVADLVAQIRERGDQWWGFTGEPTHEEIKNAISQADFNEQRNDGDMYPADRNRHIARIAFLAANPANCRPPERDFPVWILNGILQDGVHRVLAHNYLGSSEILAFVEECPT